MSMFGNMFDSMSQAARNQGGSIRMPLPFGKGGVRIPLDALGRMTESRPPVRQGRTIYENFDLNHNPLASFSGVSPEGSRMAADFRNYYRGFENLPHVRPATRPFLPGTGGTARPFDMNSAEDRHARDFIKQLNDMFGRSG